MASDKKTKAAPKAEPSVKKEAAVKKEASAAPESKSETKSETKAEPKDAGADTAKADGAEKTTDKPSNYSRGEGQKAVTQEYKDNWNAIFAKKKKR